MKVKEHFWMAVRVSSLVGRAYGSHHIHKVGCHYLMSHVRVDFGKGGGLAEPTGKLVSLEMRQPREFCSTGAALLRLRNGGNISWIGLMSDAAGLLSVEEPPTMCSGEVTGGEDGGGWVFSVIG